MIVERVDSQLKKELTEIINNEISDPRIDVTVSIFGVETSKDLSYAKVYIRAYGAEDINSLLKALNNASSYIKKLLFKRMRIRNIPTMTFFEDKSMDEGFKIEQLIKKINQDSNN